MHRQDHRGQEETEHRVRVKRIVVEVHVLEAGVGHPRQVAGEAEVEALAPAAQKNRADYL